MLKSAIIVFPGSNCDRDAAVALRHFTKGEPRMIWHKEREIPPSDLIIVPGGFSYGDYLRSGAIAAQSPIMAEVAKAARRGVAILGICNGFQILTEMELLPGALMRNANLSFICRSIRLRVEETLPPFTVSYGKGERVWMRIAHHDGNYHADDQTLARLEGEGRVLFRYADENPNGSLKAIAGIRSEAGNVLGMMPHPERSFSEALGETGGRPLFESLIRSLS